MSRTEDEAAEIEQAKRNATVAKARMQTTVGALKQRLNPKTIAADAVENVKGRTGEIGNAAKRRPGAAGAAAGVAALILFRKPIGKLARRLFSRKAKRERIERKAAKQVEKDWRVAEKNAKREAKEKERETRARERELRKAARRGELEDRGSVRLQQESAAEGAVHSSDDFTPHAARVDTAAAVPAKQE